jgi:ectoine hydroxylase-related dioxygenase (phytanoyl-CoA dioxygenase family)
MHVDRDQFLEQGYLVLRNVVPPDQLDAVRAAYERLVEQQRDIWARERQPDHPPGGVWETSAQPRLQLSSAPLADRIDGQSAPAAEIWLHENTQGASSQLLGVTDAAVTAMMLMCNPVRDHGPATWHRDLHPIDTAPLQGYIEDIVEAGPRYVQWNIPLYDDDVLWVVPGSHVRLNSEEENSQLLANPRAPLAGGVQTHLKAGDGVVYILPLLHWGSNYSTRMRRTIHGGFSIFTQYPTSSYWQHLSPSAQAAFARWTRRSAGMEDHTASALRAAIARDGSAYRAALDRLHPGRGEKGRMLTTVFLCKAACFIYLKKRPAAKVADGLRRPSASSHSITLNWGPAFADRFSADEADVLWERFQKLDALLQADEEQFVPGFQSGPMRYYFNEMPAGFGLAEFTAGWERQGRRR